jgi:hypothetical protein
MTKRLDRRHHAARGMPVGLVYPAAHVVSWLSRSVDVPFIAGGNANRPFALAP